MEHERRDNFEAGAAGRAHSRALRLDLPRFEFASAQPTAAQRTPYRSAGSAYAGASPTFRARHAFASAAPLTPQAAAPAVSAPTPLPAAPAAPPLRVAPAYSAPRTAPRTYAPAAAVQSAPRVQQLHVIIGLLCAAMLMIILGAREGGFGSLIVPPGAPGGTEATLGLAPSEGLNGIPSPAAAASIAAERSGTLPLKPTLDLKGIPSPAAAQSLDRQNLQTLPMERTTDTTGLPSSDARDAHGIDDHYGATGGGGDEAELDALIDAPLTTPGSSSALAEQASAANEALGIDGPADIELPPPGII